MKAKTLEKIATLVIGLVAALFLLLIIERAVTAPVVFKDKAGKLCGCIAAEDRNIPSIEQCDQVNMDELHEVITVSYCK